MTDGPMTLPLFEDEDEDEVEGERELNPSSRLEAVDLMMSEMTRARVRQAFMRLGVATAREQFAAVAELTGQRITSVTELTEEHAQLLLVRLTRKAEASVRRSTGNAWADRDEDTWIDKM